MYQKRIISNGITHHSFLFEIWLQIISGIMSRRRRQRKRPPILNKCFVAVYNVHTERSMRAVYCLNRKFSPERFSFFISTFADELVNLQLMNRMIQKENEIHNVVHRKVCVHHFRREKKKKQINGARCSVKLLAYFPEFYILFDISSTFVFGSFLRRTKS